jgi:hypothetical protein
VAAVGNANEILDGHVVLDLECLDRIDMNAYVPKLHVGGYKQNSAHQFDVEQQNILASAAAADPHAQDDNELHEPRCRRMASGTARSAQTGAGLPWRKRPEPPREKRQDLAAGHQPGRNEKSTD